MEGDVREAYWKDVYVPETHSVAALVLTLAELAFALDFS
jgi:hypothetical protein